MAGDVVVTVTSDTTAAQKSWQDFGTSMTRAMSAFSSYVPSNAGKSMVDAMSAPTRNDRAAAEADARIRNQMRESLAARTAAQAEEQAMIESNAQKTAQAEARLMIDNAARLREIDRENWRKLRLQREQESRNAAVITAGPSLFSQLNDGATARQLQDPFRGINNSMKASMGGMEQGGNSLRMIMNQAAFAAQDLAVVLQQGGKNSLGRALIGASNNIGAMGMFLGQWGMGIATATAILSPFAAKLFETEDGADVATAAIKKTADAAKEATARFTEARESHATFATNLKRVDSSSGAQGLKRSLQDEADKLEREVNQKRTDIEDMDQQWMHRGADSQAIRPSTENGAMDELKNMDGKLSRLRQQQHDAELKEIKLRGKESSDETDAELSRRHAEREAEKDRLAEDATRRAKAREDAARDVFKLTRTPAEKFKEEMRALGGMFGRGEIDADTYSRREKQLMAEAGRGGSKNERLENPALLRGSREALEAQIRAANPESSEKDKGNELLQKIADGQRELINIERQKRGLPPGEID